MNSALALRANALSIQDADPIDALIASVMKTLASSSQRVYGQTYDLWKDWCHAQGEDPLSLSPANILTFLSAQHVTKTTRQRQFSAMRKLVDVLALLDGGDDVRRAAEFLRMVKPSSDNLSTSERSLHALTPDEVGLLIDCWPGTTGNLIHLRNRALITLMLATGLRRSEIVALLWDDVDLERGWVYVRHGKGSKARHASIVGEYAIDALMAWKRANLGQCVFRPLSSTGALLEDVCMSADNLYRIVKETERATGVLWSPHTARRTLATELLAQNAPLPDVQEQMGHVRGSTTLIYAKAADAETRRKRFKTRYGQ